MPEFRGRSYYADKATGYYRTSSYHGDREYLHRAIYRAEYGNIPQGWHVHHKDGNLDNNTVGNLECLPMQEHLYGRHHPWLLISCAVCGKPVSTRVGHALYCGRVCKTRVYRQRKKTLA